MWYLTYISYMEYNDAKDVIIFYIEQVARAVEMRSVSAIKDATYETREMWEKIRPIIHNF